MTFKPLVSELNLVVLSVLGISLVLVPLFRESPKRWGTAVRRLLMVGLLVFSLAGPARAVEEENITSNVEIILAVDRTGSMAAEDGPEGAPRMEAVRRDIRTLVEEAASARFAIVTWDSSARLELPVTTDASAAVHFADNLHQEVTEFSTGSTLERPAAVVAELLENSAEERPANLRYLVVISDGEATAELGEPGPFESEWTAVTPLIDGGAVLGYGTEEGGPMRIYGAGGQGVTEEYMTDDRGEVAISRIDEDSLQALASELGVVFLANPSTEQIEQLAQDFIAGADTVIEGRSSTYTYVYLTWVPALALAALLTWEAAAFTRRVLWLRRTHAI